MLAALIRFCVRNPVITLAVSAAAVAWGWSAWSSKTVDAIPDISENQTVVLTEWAGRSPQDVEDQITYPLSTQLAGVRGVKEVRGLSGFGFSQVYVVFEDRLRFFQGGAVADFYEARTRVLEKLAAVQEDLPAGVVPELGPDATALGQIFWYTLEGPQDLDERRSAQDFIVRYALQSVAGVAEVASVGGMVRQYQIDIDPNRLAHFDVGLMELYRAVARANIDVGGKTIESAGMEYIVRGLGFVRALSDVEEIVVERRGAARGGPAVRVRDLAEVSLGPAFRRGALADERRERVGGVVIMRFGENPRDVIARVKEKITQLNDPASAALPGGMRIVPFYDRTQLIDETTATLETALLQELMITIAVVLLFLLHLRSSLIIAATLPIAVLLSFILMEGLGVDSNIMSLTGIAIAIGTMVDMGIVMTENVYQHVLEERGRRPAWKAIEEAAIEVGPALLTAVATTIISFVPIFFLTDQEGKLFRPLAWTKTFALGSAAITGILLVPVLCRLFLHSRKAAPGWARPAVRASGIALLAALLGFCAARLHPLGLSSAAAFALATLGSAALMVVLTRERLRPLEKNPVSRCISGIYAPVMRWILAHKLVFLSLPALIVLWGALTAFGGGLLTAPAAKLFGEKARELRAAAWLEEAFPGLGQEFMPPLDEGSLLYMPSLLPAAGLDQTLEVMERQNAQIASLPEVAKVVGKLGRAETALDPAPIGMLETIVILKARDQWRPGIQKEDIVRELMERVHTPGVSEGRGAWLQPIETRVIMLNSGIRAPMAVKLIGVPKDEQGRSLDSKDAVARLERVAYAIRDLIAAVPGVAGPNVENMGGKPYLEYEIDRVALGHLGLDLGAVTDAIAVAVGGREITRSLEGRERYGIRLAYQRELRDSLESLLDIRVRAASGELVPIRQVAHIRDVVGPAAIKTEDGLVRLHITFAAAGRAEGAVMEDVLARIRTWRASQRAEGHPDPVPVGVAVEAAGRYEAQIRARERFAVLIPICLGLIFFLLYLNFRSWLTTLNVFAAVPVVVAGGLILIRYFPAIQDQMYAWGLWDRPSTGPIYLTVAVVVGFIALLGIATDDGVVIATYLEQTFRKRRASSVAEIRAAVVEAGLRRIRPCLMTTFTTIIALYPILASTGRGSDVAQPMALPAVGGMIVELISLFVVPCVYCWVKETQYKFARPAPGGEEPERS